MSSGPMSLSPGSSPGAYDVVSLRGAGGQAVPLVTERNFWAGYETPDGRFVIYTSVNQSTGTDVMALPSGGTPVALAATPSTELPTGDSSFSPSPHANEFVVTEMPFARGQTLRVLTNWEKRLGR